MKQVSNNELRLIPEKYVNTKSGLGYRDKQLSAVIENPKTEMLEQMREVKLTFYLVGLLFGSFRRRVKISGGPAS